MVQSADTYRYCMAAGFHKNFPQQDVAEFNKLCDAVSDEELVKFNAGQIFTTPMSEELVRMNNAFWNGL